MSKRANEYSAKISGADTAWYHCDALGSPRKMSNETGHACWQSRYYPFGEMFTQVGSGNSHTFTGKELDSETGLNYFCQRYYDPEMGRFMELDPKDSPTSSPYAYCVNNPLAFTDPTGEAAQVPVEMTGDVACLPDPYGMGWWSYNVWTARSAQMDPDAWAPGWDYTLRTNSILTEERAQMIRDAIFYLSSGICDYPVLTYWGWVFINPGEWLKALNIMINISTIKDVPNSGGIRLAETSGNEITIDLDKLIDCCNMPRYWFAPVFNKGFTIWDFISTLYHEGFHTVFPGWHDWEEWLIRDWTESYFDKVRNPILFP